MKKSRKHGQSVNKHIVTPSDAAPNTATLTHTSPADILARALQLRTEVPDVGVSLHELTAMKIYGRK
jgi:hypothetical protein